MTAVARVASGLPSEQRLTFPGTYRLKKRADFQRIYTHGVRVPGRYVVLFVARAELPTGRYGITASRKVGGAVVRARCKRRLRELYRLHRQQCDVAKLDIVANARGSCASVPWGDLERDFLRCLTRGGTLGASGKAHRTAGSGS